MTILALDLATYKTGYAIFADKKLHNYGLINATEGNYHLRLLYIREKIIELIKKYKIDYIVLEEVPMGIQDDLSKTKSLLIAHDLCVCQGVIVGICAQFGLGLRLYLPTQWRSIMETYSGTDEGKKRDFQKEKAVSLTNELCGLNFKYYKSDSKKRNEYSDDDICEAILLGMAFLKGEENNG